MILGLVLGAFMVALLFHVIGVGTAAMWREVAQDAADNTAYESAVWTARGMNVVVALNIFMAIVMAVLIAWRMIMLFLAALIILGGLGCATSFIPGLAWMGAICALIGPTNTALRTMVKHDPKIAGRVYQVILMLHQGQKVVASATPVISVARSYLTTHNRYGVNLAVGVGFHLFPTRTLTLTPREKPKEDSKPCPNNTCCKPKADPKTKPPRKTPFKTQDLTGLLGAPFSLPVMAINEIKTLCAMGGIKFIVFIDALFEYMGDKIGGLPGDVLKGAVSDGSPVKIAFAALTGVLSGFFCEDLKGGLKKLAGDASGCASDQSCRDNADANSGDPSSTGFAPKDVGETEDHKGRKISSDDLRWSLVWPLAINGSLFTQHWGIVRADRSFQHNLNGALKIADAFNTSGATPHSVDNTATLIAQAEIFYDCEGSWLDDPKCYLASSWTLNWRARLRRVHDPLEMASGLIEEQLVDTLWTIIGDGRIAQHVPGINLIQDYIQSLNFRLIPQFPGDGTHVLRQQMSGGANAGGSNAAQKSLELTPGYTSQMVH